MRRTHFGGWLLLVVTTVLIYVLDHPLGALPAIGRLVDPVNGCWVSAEAVNRNFSDEFKMPALKGKAAVWFDKRLVPHIHASNDHDLYFMEGYVHAYFRLWQMDMETRAAAGRVSEVVGDKALAFDRKQRYKGMVYAAENSMNAMKRDNPAAAVAADAYTEGINAYISSLSYRSFPFEYKLMGFAPEKWDNLKIALLLKYMADDLTGKTDDFALTYLRDILPKGELDMLFPDRIMGATPVIPSGIAFDKPSLSIPAAPPDSVAFPRFKPSDFGEQKEDGKGSNNWAVSGARTASGAAILCNDPHLGLNLPSLWFEVQMQAPGINCYGASLPGAPGIIIGFNDSVSWGVTNNYRDVKDFYLIKEVPGGKDKYWFAGRQLDYKKRAEVIKIRNKPDEVDTVNYTIHGPVTYDKQNRKDGGPGVPLAMCWMGHRPTNELLAIYLLNRANNYNAFVDAILHFECPAQNFAYADKAGNIALWGQGQFVNKWKDQGKYIMNGSDSATLWKELIPMRENPHAFNPQRGYLFSANEVTADSTYPYQYNGSGWVNLRAWRIDEVLGGLQKATMQDMFALQQDTYSPLAAGCVPVMLRNLQTTSRETQKGYIDALSKWNYRLEAESVPATFFQIWWGYFYDEFWTGKNCFRLPGNMLPLQERTMQLLQEYGMQDTTIAYKTNVISRYLTTALRSSFQSAVDSMRRMPPVNSSALMSPIDKHQWYYVKNTSIKHLTKLPALSYDHLKIGGWGNTVNAAKGDHGPSWRMVVQMGAQTEAYCVYPGGQSGNPGSSYYGSFIEDWAAGRYYRIAFLPNDEKQTDTTIKFTWKVQPE